MMIFMLFPLCSTDAAAEAGRDIRTILAQLTLEQKAAQVLMVNVPGSRTLSDSAAAQFKGTVPGAIILFGYNIADTPDKVRGFINSCTHKLSTAQQHTGKPAIPPFYALDNEGGSVYRTRKLTDALPAAESVPELFSVEQAEAHYRHIGVQMKHLGITLNLAPVAEVKTAENAPVLGTRCFSTDSDTAGAYSAAAVRGMRAAGIFSAVKHFPGNGAADLHTGGDVLRLSLTDLEKNAASFRPPLAAGADFLLVSHITVSVFGDEPFCFSKKGIAWMRTTLPFSGVVLTDDIAMKAVKQNGVTSADNAIRALRAGCDMIMCSEQNIYPVIAAVAAAARTDTAFAARLDEAVLRILQAKQKAALLPLPYS